MSRHHNPNSQRALRAALTPIVNTGDAICPRCHTPIHPGQAWDAGHRLSLSLGMDTDHGSTDPATLIEMGDVQAEHRKCNRAAGARLGNKQRSRAPQAQNPTVTTATPVLSASTVTPAPVVSSYIHEEPVGMRPVVRSGLVLPRIETPRTKGVRSLGATVIREVNGSGVLGGFSLLPWQEYALKRAFELKDGRLRWRTVIITIGRQQGKSVLARSVCWWRIHQGERFGEPQLLLHTANLQNTAREVWRPAAMHALARHGKKAAKFGRGTEEIDLADQGHGRWLVQAATDSTGVGYSLSMGLIDEAWDVARKIADESMRPAMSEREQPQLWMVSTAGDGASDLLQTYRDLAIQDTRGEGDILLLEWSAPPEAAYDDQRTWRWASPHWSPRREEFLRSQLQAIPEGAFRTQYLNQWVKAVNAWIPATSWARCASSIVPEGVPDVVAVEESMDGVRYAAVAGWRSGGGVIIRSYITNSPSQLWRRVEQWEPRLLLLPGTLAGRYHGRRRVQVVTSSDNAKAMPGVARGIADGLVWHDPADLGLADDVGRAVAAQTDTMVRLSRSRSTGPIEACKAMVWAVGELQKPAPARPMVRAAG